MYLKQLLLPKSICTRNLICLCILLFYQLVIFFDLYYAECLFVIFFLAITANKDLFIVKRQTTKKREAMTYFLFPFFSMLNDVEILSDDVAHFLA